MDALQLIKNNLDVERVLEYYDFNKAKPSGDKIRACCKIHDGDNESGFVIDVETGLWTCHTGGCGSGDVFHLVQKLENVGFPVAVHKVADVLGIDITSLEIVARTQTEKKELEAFKKAVKRLQVDEHPEYIPSATVKRVKAFKEFNLSTIEHFGLVLFEEFVGTNSEGEPFTLKDRLAFPIKQGGKIIGYSLRATQKNHYPKWLHQPTRIKTGEILYNFEEVIGEPEVVVVEGITDVWAYHEIGIPAVATYGAKISEHQMRLLLQLGSDLVFSFDGDEAGQSAMEKAYEMFHKTSNIKFVHLPKGSDPESITREELTKHYEQKDYSYFSKDT